MEDQSKLASALAALLIILASFALVGCDVVAVAERSSAQPTASQESPEEQAGENAATMDSIGPDSSMRVYYQFTDDRGSVQFVERLSDVPEAWRSRVGYVEMNQPPPLTPEAARRSWKVSASRAAEIALARQTPRGSGRRMDDFQSGGEVVLYSATWCGYCTKARAHLDGAGIDYQIRDVDNGSIARELKEKTGRGGVPVLDFGGEILRGYSRQQYDQAVRSIKG